MTRKDKAIRKFAKAMRTADNTYIALSSSSFPLTENMRFAFYEYIEACLEEFHAQSVR